MLVYNDAGLLYMDHTNADTDPIWTTWTLGM